MYIQAYLEPKLDSVELTKRSFAKSCTRNVLHTIMLCQWIRGLCMHNAWMTSVVSDTCCMHGRFGETSFVIVSLANQSIKLDDSARQPFAIIMTSLPPHHLPSSWNPQKRLSRLKTTQPDGSYSSAQGNVNLPSLLR